MVTDKMIEAFWSQVTVTRVGSIVGLEKGIERAIREMQSDAEPVAWMHPDAGWVHHDKAVIAAHCRKDGTGPVPLYAKV